MQETVDGGPEIVEPLTCMHCGHTGADVLLYWQFRGRRFAQAAECQDIPACYARRKLQEEEDYATKR